MTPEEHDNIIRAQCKRCTEEIKKAMSRKPKPNWDSTVKPIIKKHYQTIAPLGITLLEFVVQTGRLNGRFGVES